ncbi:MAG: response regulator [Acidobacteria bacterium]|nr:response regulator [Acidobacteriota bacterium]
MNQFESARGVLHVAVVTDVTVQKRQEQQLREAGEEIRKLGLWLLTAEEEAARALARELHDDITQRLALLSMEMSNRAKDPASGALGPVLRGYQAQLLEISTGVRRISHQMHPAILEHFGLSAAIESLCEEMSARSGVLIRYRGASLPDGVDRNVALCLYRVGQECLRNMEKHAEAECAEVSLTGTEDGLELAVVDSGKGFAAGSQGRGLGVYSMEERVRLVGGTLRIDSAAGEGTRVVVRIPLQRQAGQGPVEVLAGAPEERAEETAAAAAEETVRILLADDHALLLKGTKSLLPRGYEVVGTAGDGQQAVAAALRLRPDVVVCDVSMPGMNGLEAVKRIRTALPLTKVVFLSMHNSPLFLRRAMEAGGDA